MTNGHQRCWDTLFSLLEPLIYVLSGVGVLVYIIQYISSLANNTQPIVSPIELAGVIATLGGLILIGAFYKDNTAFGQHLKTSAKLLLGSSILYIITFFLLEEALFIKSPTPEWIITTFAVISDVVMIFAGITLVAALGRLVRILPQL